ncbi:MAG: hypothetical protein GQ570_04000 [Helicobacteraceae bacterium]|nr:hypothetical protein [Helicobacteraceae bacterium]
MAIRLYSGGSLTNWAEWDIAGGDNFSILSNGVNGFTLLVLDPTTTPSRTNGTWSTAAVDRFAIWIDTDGSARADNLFIDQILVGNGLKVTGTSSAEGWQDIIDADMGTIGNTWGILQGTSGSELLAHGKITIGDDAGSLATVFSDTGKSIKFISQQYRTSGGSFANMVADGFLGIDLVDNATNATQFTDGIIVGADNGRDGSTFAGSDLHTTAFDASALTHASSFIKCYNTTFKLMDAGVSYHNNSASLFYGGAVTSCGQFDPVGNPILRNLSISGYTGTAGAVLWNENIDLRKSNFIANTDVTNDPAAIEHGGSVGSPYDYFDLVFSGNDFDGINTSGTNISVNNNGTSDASNDTGANTITYLSSATLSMTVVDEAGDPISTAFAYIDDNNADPFIMNTTTNASGIASVGHTAGAVVGATWRIRKYGYKPYRAIVDIPASGTKDVPVTLIVDPQQT